ncbi:DNA-binding response regulator [Paenibacillus mesophilus]|uniref:DNA-binding response regulator n=1 Tax=Paenibacillus mesophilus TaxID=2582849 RepID=UPI00110DD9E4|nr:DNA-binding response regulator [Paenibacillus mesophilus]TMV51416.1 DNA-binding response regulator [Paenibacillus mesophilus]
MARDKAYAVWIGNHQSQRSGERLRRLNEGHGHAEKLFAETVWWPAFGNFDSLHPEYEVFDFKDGSRFLDFAYIQGVARICIEIDGFGPHRRDIDRRQFSDELTRQNHLVIDGWIVIRFSYDDVKEKPRHCQQLLLQLMGRLAGMQGKTGTDLTVMEKEAVRLVFRQNGVITPGELFRHLGLGRRKGMQLIENLLEKKWLIPATGSLRIRTYRLNGERRLPF